MSNEAIKPCPFCGGTEQFVERADYSSAYVQCDSRVDEHSVCMARGPIAVQDDDGEEVPGAEGSIAAWNRRTAHVEQGGEVYQVRINHSCADDWTDCNKLDYERFTGLSMYSTRILYTHPAPVAPVPGLGRVTNHDNGYLDLQFIDEASAAAFMSALVLDVDVDKMPPIQDNPTMPSIVKPTPATGSIGDDAEFKVLLLDVVQEYSDMGTFGNDPRVAYRAARAALVQFIDARTPAGNTSQGDVGESGTLLVENGVTTWVRGALGALPDGIYGFYLNTTPVATPAAAPPPPAAVAPEQADDWQPIETVPEATHVLFAAEFDGPEDWRIKVGTRYDGKFFVYGASWTPTMWRHLPPPPGQAAPVQDTSVRDSALDEAVIWLLDNYQDYENVGSLCDALLISLRSKSTPAQSVALSDAEINVLHTALFDVEPRGVDRDHACVKCIPGSPVLKAGFLCDLHSAQAIIARISGKGAM